MAPLGRISWMGQVDAVLASVSDMLYSWGLMWLLIGAGIFFNLCTADQYISIILSGRLFRELYARRGLEERLLSRSVEDSATVCSVLVPWNSCGMTQATVLGVSTFVYAPYCIFNIVSPLMSLLVAAVGWNIKRKK